MTTFKPFIPETYTALSREAAAANLFAARRMAGWLATKPEELLKQETVSSFPSLAETIHHIAGIERHWLNILQGWESLTPWGRKGAFEGSVADLLEASVKAAEDFYLYVKDLDEEDLLAEVAFPLPVRFPETETFERQRFLLIHHVATHGMYHRGQLVTMARTLGLMDAPMTGVLAYTLTGL